MDRQLKIGWKRVPRRLSPERSIPLHGVRSSEALAAELLLVGLSERMGRPFGVPQPSVARRSLSRPGPARHGAFQKPRRAALPRPQSPWQLHRRTHRQLPAAPRRDSASNIGLTAIPSRCTTRPVASCVSKTTLAKTADFKVFRPLQDQSQRALAWRPLRKGIAYFHRRAQLSQRANDSYLEALATVEDTTPPCIRSSTKSPNPSPTTAAACEHCGLEYPNDIALLQAVSRGEFATAGFRNRDLRHLLHPTHFDASTANIRKLSACISRQLRILRAHGLIRKIPKSSPLSSHLQRPSAHRRPVRHPPN